MLETMYAAPGVGLAAPQVGVMERLVVADVAEGEERRPMVLVNPEILWRSPERATAEEGCLSLPNQFADVTRPQAVRLSHRDEHGQEHELAADGLLARCVQHELDHLDGVLFVDHLSALKRNMIMRKLIKNRARVPTPARRSASRSWARPASSCPASRRCSPPATRSPPSTPSRPAPPAAATGSGARPSTTRPSAWAWRSARPAR